ncbi:MAG: hypothetical protein WA183_11745 [Chthoniobacterales bacterium]
MNNQPDKRPRGAPLRPHPPELKERGYQLYEQGKSNPEIANALDIPVSTLARWSSKGKWKLRRQLASRPGIELGALTPTDQDILDEISQLTFEEKQALYDEMMSDHALRVAYIVKGLSPQGVVVNADKIKKLDETARKALKLESDKPRPLINIALLSYGTVKEAKVVSDVPAPDALTYEADTGCKPVSQSAEDAAAIAPEPSPGPAFPAPPIAPGAGL